MDPAEIVMSCGTDPAAVGYVVSNERRRKSQLGDESRHSRCRRSEPSIVANDASGELCIRIGADVHREAFAKG